MLKKILAIVLAAQIAVTPAIAQQSLPAMNTEQEAKFCKAIIGIDDALLVAAVTFMITHLGITYLQNWGRGREIEKLKAEAKQRCGA